MGRSLCSTTRCAICAALTAAAIAIGLIFILSYVYWWPTDNSTDKDGDMDNSVDPPSPEQPCPSGDFHTGYIATGSTVAVNSDVVAYLSRPVGTSCKGAVLIFHDIYGYGLPANQQVADDLAQNGYVAILPDLFRGNPWQPDMYEYVEWKTSHSQERIDGDIDATVSFIRSALSVDNLAVVGFCWGGLQSVFASARLSIDAAVAFYGVGITPDDLISMNKPTLLLHGQNDTIISVTDVELLESTLHNANRLLQSVDDLETGALRGPPSYVKIFEDVGHSFAHRGDMDDPVIRQASEEAFNDMYRWISRFTPG
ncbi:carboxymethylenebutenolidase homolog [Saccoglossus kowalevskii]|uniref:Carboxymethylenebutenolidase homolog n=1 Tax=Saccoglossus kowalevskii TaxID=10224 RepID=A0A1L7H7F2_SACKO|nr:PREDICTED: carboxymethylenebutenolidase homolog [Saccoglossus kowalevskii]APU50772.1 dienelactone hydrolase-like protein 278 [Saccoglossus kowalevskii]